MFATTIVPEASSEAFISQQELDPILASTRPVPGEKMQKGAYPAKKASGHEEFPSWEYFLNELEFE